MEKRAGHLNGQRRADTSELKFLFAQHVGRGGFSLIIGSVRLRIFVGKFGLEQVNVNIKKHGNFSRRRQFGSQFRNLLYYFRGEKGVH